MEEMFFTSGRGLNLYGAYSRPRGKDRRMGILICGSIAHEQIRSRPYIELLSETLEECGFHIFKFDYSGMGDSEGEFEDFSFPDWVDDVRAAQNELRSAIGLEKIALVAHRVGALSALEHVRNSEFRQDLLLWHPVDCGMRFLDEAEKNNLRWNQGTFIGAGRKARVEGEILGFQYSDAIRNSLGEIRIAKQHFASPKSVSTIAYNDSLYTELGLQEQPGRGVRLIKGAPFWEKATRGRGESEVVGECRMICEWAMELQ